MTLSVSGRIPVGVRVLLPGFHNRNPGFSWLQVGRFGA